MPHVRALAGRKFSEVGPLPHVPSLGENLAVVLFCQQEGRELRVPEGEPSETLFNVLAGEGLGLEGEVYDALKAGNVMDALPGEGAPVAGEGETSVLGPSPRGGS